MGDGLVGAKTGRGPRGRFVPGNDGGPGRPARPIEKHYLRAISEACPLETWQEIVAKAVELAKAGDGQARSWLAKYLCGEKSSLSESVPLAERLSMGFE